MTGRAMAVFTMAMFLGVADHAVAHGLARLGRAALHVETYAAVLGAIAVFLVLGALLFRLLPGPARQRGHGRTVTIAP
jgi:hypothetical protein